MFILSVALHVEIGRQIKLNTKDIAIKNKVKKYSLSVFRNKAQNISVFLLSQVALMITPETKEEYNIERKERLVLKENGNLGNINNLEIKKEKEKKEKNSIKKRKKEKLKATQMIYRLYIVLYYICCISQQYI